MAARAEAATSGAAKLVPPPNTLHVLALSSITKLARGSRTHRFKCPYLLAYCPAECSTAMAKQLLL